MGSVCQPLVLPDRHPNGWGRALPIDPLECKCGGVMKIISFIERGQRDVVERIRRGHQSGAMVGGLWEGPIRILASACGPPNRLEPDPASHASSNWCMFCPVPSCELGTTAS